MHLFGYHICSHSLYYQQFKLSILFPSEVNVSSTAECRFQMVEVLVGKYFTDIYGARLALHIYHCPTKGTTFDIFKI